MAKIGALSKTGNDGVLVQRTFHLFQRVRRIFSPSVPELAPREAYRLWAENYPPYAHNLLMEVEEQAMQELLPPVRGKRVLDLACGTGRYARLLQERGAHVIALDFSFEMLIHTQAHLARTQADMRMLPLRDACADVIVCGLAVGHLANLQDGVREIARVLAAQGTFVYSDFHAAARDWKRTFQANHKTYAVKHFAHDEQAQRAALREAGLSVETLQTVHISHEVARTDARAEYFRTQWGDAPVALVVRARKL